jgi:hypothetical protein
MTSAERQARWRWKKALLKGYCDRWKRQVEVNWMRDGEPLVIARSPRTVTNFLSHIGGAPQDT